jgi:hypothetical protein
MKKHFIHSNCLAENTQACVWAKNVSVYRKCLPNRQIIPNARISMANALDFYDILNSAVSLRTQGWEAAETPRDNSRV